MITEELLHLHEQCCSAAYDIMASKNHDYAGGNDDALNNFKASLAFNVEPEIGLMIRMMDKMKRVESFVKNGMLLVPGETVKDTIVDLINYPVLLQGLLNERKDEEVDRE